jgi:DNA-binding Xre family transcriptional regulator
LIVVDYPGIRTGWWPACGRSHDADLEAELAAEADDLVEDLEKLRALREKRFLSHRELAKNAGVSPTTVLNLEAGKVSEAQRRTIRKLAEALRVDPGDLVKG